VGEKKEPDEKISKEERVLETIRFTLKTPFSPVLPNTHFGLTVLVYKRVCEMEGTQERIYQRARVQARGGDEREVSC